MDSCSSSPSHSFKDRPHSRHGDLSRQPSFPQNLDRAKSPAPKAVPENRGTSSRDLARRSSYGACGSEKEGADSRLSSPEKSRSSLRKPFGFDRAERQGDLKTELHRSTRVHVPSRKPDRESIDMAVRVPIRRSSHGADGHRREGSEGLSSSSLQGGAFKRGYDRESVEIKRRASKSPEFDDDANRSPASGRSIGFIRSDGKDSFKGSPRTPLGCTPKRDLGGEARTPRTSPVKESLEKGMLASPIRAFGRERLDDTDVTSPKTKLFMVKEKEMHKEQEANSGETETKSSSKNMLIKSRNGWGVDTIEGEQSLKARDLLDEKSMSFSHISKRARSDRDRGRRDEHSIKAIVRQTQGNENVMDKDCSADRLSFHENVRKTDSIDAESEARYEARHKEESFMRGTDGGAIHANERSLEKMEFECPVSTNGHSSDMEEGELEPECHIEQSKPGFIEEKAAGSEERGETEKQNGAVLLQETKGKEGCDSVVRVAVGEEKRLNGHGEERHRSRDDVDEDCDSKDVKLLSPGKAENHGVSADSEVTAKSAPVPSTIAAELGESSRPRLMFDLLGTRAEAKSLNALSTDKSLFTNRELTLSLFTQPSESNGPLLGEGDTRIEVSDGKQTENLHGLEAGLTRLYADGSREELSQHSGHKQKKLKMESLQLSLALPGTSNMVAGSNLPRAHSEPERSFPSLSHTQTQTQNPAQSQTYTNSDGFATSFSFSQSESFVHNPSCSLNCTSLENQELSCGGSKQISQGTEQMSNRSWPALSGNDGMHTVTSLSQEKSKHRRGIPLYQRVLQNGSMHHGFSSVSGSNRTSGSNHVPQRNHHFGQRFQDAPKILDSSSQDLEGSGRHINTHKDIMESVRQQKAWFASKQQAMSGEPRSEPNAPQSRDKLAGSPAFNLKGPSSAENDILVGERRNVSSERVGLQEITTEPIAAMAQKLQELPDSFLEGLRGVAKGVLGSFEKREEFIALQDNIRRRTDLTEDTLLRAHRTQLEILVALKMGIQTFVQEGSKPQTYKALIEIFLQTRCRNVACQQPLPVCGCECRICLKKSGFCHECMCVVCFKFDSDYNTCRWVGCNLCLHWCHTDCGLRMSHIAPTSTAKNSSGTTEMQYHCVACDHKSELFGFVKEVFHKCAETWGAEILAKELDCVRRIYHGSEDMRGKQLCREAEQMLQNLETKVDAAEVCRSILRFFQEGIAELDGANGPNKKSSSSKVNDAPCHAADLAGESVPKTTSSGGGGGKLADMDNARAGLHNFDGKLEEKRTEASELQYDRARKRAEIEDIESVVRVKQAEAKMFQVRADEARQEAGGLQRIISVKREKIDEDYACKYAKLRLSEVEERQTKRLEELHALESAQQEFQKMKNRMEAEIKELMLKMEIAKRQLA